MNLAHVWPDPKRDLAVVVATNISSPAANEALPSSIRNTTGNDVIPELPRQYDCG